VFVRFVGAVGARNDIGRSFSQRALRMTSIASRISRV